MKLKYGALIVALLASLTLVACYTGKPKVVINQSSGGSGNGANTYPGCDNTSSSGSTVTLCANPSTIEINAQKALDNAKPGETIVFPAGKFYFTHALQITNTKNLTLKGQGQDKTILDFSGMTGGGLAALIISTNGVKVEGLQILNSPTDGIRVEGPSNTFLDTVTFNKVHVEWNIPPNHNHGGYGFYPVRSKNVLIENSTCIGSEDACIYVGQSKDIVVKNTTVSKSVVGIELESSSHADVYNNISHDNSVGMLFYSEAGLPTHFDESDYHVYDNKIYNNNTPNFGAGYAGSAPTGSGVLILSANHIELDHNEIHDNQAFNIGLINYVLLDANNGPPKYVHDPAKGNVFDPYVRAISIHDNAIYHGGYSPVTPDAFSQDSINNGKLVETLFPTLPIPDIIWTRMIDPLKDKNGQFIYQDPNDATQNNAAHKICIFNNTGANYKAGGQTVTTDVMYSDLVIASQTPPEIKAGSGIHNCDGSKLNLRTSAIQLPQD